jgi:hypothetical protein
MQNKIANAARRIHASVQDGISKCKEGFLSRNEERSTKMQRLEE